MESHYRLEFWTNKKVTKLVALTTVLAAFQAVYETEGGQQNADNTCRQWYGCRRIQLRKCPSGRKTLGLQVLRTLLAYSS